MAFVALNVIQSLVNMLLMPQVPTIGQGKNLKVLFMALSLFFFCGSSEIGYFGIYDDSHVLDLVANL